MEQKWIQMLVVLVFYEQITPGAAVDQEVTLGSGVEIKCKPGKGTMVLWFRALDQSGMEFIGSFSPNGLLKTRGPSYDTSFKSHINNGDEYSITLNSYKSSDSGIYSCGMLVGGNELKFGELTRLYERKKETTTTTRAPLTCTTQPTPSTTTTNCCKNKMETGPTSLSMTCPLIILAPLAGGCGLLLLLLIVITVYCNNMRTRRCPHHYKRKLRTGVPEKMMTNI